MKKCIRSFIEVVSMLTMFPLIFVPIYLYMYMYYVYVCSLFLLYLLLLFSISTVSYYCRDTNPSELCLKKPTKSRSQLKLILITDNLHLKNSPVGWGCRIHKLNLCSGVRPPPPMSIMDMTPNNLMVKLQ